MRVEWVTRGLDAAFENEHDTDFCVAAERRNLADAITALHDESGRHLALSIGGNWVTRAGEVGFDPSLVIASVVTSLLTLLVMARYPLTDKRFKEITAETEARKAAALAATD